MKHLKRFLPEKISFRQWLIFTRILKSEKRFVETFEDEGFKSQKLIVSFNQEIAKRLKLSEDIYSDYYGLTMKDKQIIQRELAIKGHYYYE